MIFESPNKKNVAYIVNDMPKDADLDQYFGWLVDELGSKKELCKQTIIYYVLNKTSVVCFMAPLKVCWETRCMSLLESQTSGNVAFVYSFV